MNISRKRLDEAVGQGIISDEQADALAAFFDARHRDTPRLDVTHALYYVGGLIAIGAMTLLMSLGWDAYGGAGMVAISTLYAVVGLVITRSLARRGLAVPAGIGATFVVCLTPLAVFGLHAWLGDGRVGAGEGRELLMSLATLAAGLAMLWRYRYPFVVMPMAIAFWFSVAETTTLIGGGMSWEPKTLVSTYSGLLMVGVALWIDIKTRRTADFAFWLYAIGALVFWSGLTFRYAEGLTTSPVYLVINLLMMSAGVVLVRRALVGLGGLGLFGYLGYLASSVFEGSWLFPVSLTALGLSIVYLGVFWQKHEATIVNRARRLLPRPVRKVLEPRLRAGARPDRTGGEQERR